MSAVIWCFMTQVDIALRLQHQVVTSAITANSDSVGSEDDMEIADDNDLRSIKVTRVFRVGADSGGAGTRVSCGQCTVCDANCGCIGPPLLRECFCYADAQVTCNTFTCYGQCFN